MGMANDGGCDADTAHLVAKSAASQILDRACGKPMQAVETRIEKADVRDMTDEELLAVIQSERTAAVAN